MRPAFACYTHVLTKSRTKLCFALQAFAPLDCTKPEVWITHLKGV